MAQLVESTCNAGDLGWEDPLEKETLPTPVSWPREFHGLYSPWGLKKSDLHSVLAHKLQAEKHDVPNRHEIRYLETILCYLCPPFN